MSLELPSISHPWVPHEEPLLVPEDVGPGLIHPGSLICEASLCSRAPGILRWECRRQPPTLPPRCVVPVALHSDFFLLFPQSCFDHSGPFAFPREI